jgi:hypothetical protein
MPTVADSWRVNPMAWAAKKGQVDPGLGARSEEDERGVGQKRPEIGQGPEAQKDQGRDHLPLDAVMVESPEQPLVRFHQRRQGQVGEDDAETDGQEQQRFIVPGDGQVDQD